MLTDCEEELLNRNPPDATITSIASIYAHIVFGEDAIIRALFQGKPVLYQDQGWASKTGVPFPGFPPTISPEWAATVKMDLPAFQAYARAVFAAEDAYLAGVSGAEFGRKVTGPFGEQTIGSVLVNVLGTHAAQHAGEIAALRGVQGLKGLPF